MKQALIIITIIFATITCYAQQYAVYRVKGEVCQVVKKKKVPMKKGMKLSAKDILNMFSHASAPLRPRTLKTSSRCEAGQAP